MLIEELSFLKEKIISLKEKTNFPVVILGKNGNLYYRKKSNDINIYGLEWHKFTFLEEEDVGLGRVVDFDISSKDLITVNSNGKISIMYDLNRPRYKDI
jgi:hypothetical protein